MITRLRDKYNSKITRLREEGEPTNLLHILMEVVSAIVQLLYGKIYFFRKCEQGPLLMVKGKPKVENKGFISFGKNVKIWSSIERTKIFVGRQGVLTIGDDTVVNGAHLSASLDVKIGKNVNIGPYTVISDDDFHEIAGLENQVTKAPIIIEDDVWITMRCTIMKGVTIGRGSVVASGAVVTKNIPPYSIVGGIPARVIKSIPH